MCMHPFGVHMRSPVDKYLYIWFDTLLRQMEQNQTPPQPMPSSEQVSFPHPAGSEKRSNGIIKWIIVIIGVIAIVAAGIFFIMRTSGEEGGEVTASPTPTTNSLNSFATPVPSPTEEPSPTPSSSAEPADR